MNNASHNGLKQSEEDQPCRYQSASLDGGTRARPGGLPPEARKDPHRRQAHGDVFVDPYEWMRDKDSTELRTFIFQENDYCKQRTAHLSGLKQTLFDELKERTVQTDMSVPTRMDGYWYFMRISEGQQYSVQCRLPIKNPDDWDPPQVDAQGPSLAGEQVIFDANAEAKGHDFFQLGGMDLSRDGRWLLYGIDTAGEERYDFRVRDLRDGSELPDLLESIGSACLSPDGRWVFYTVLDQAWRPFAVRRHELGAPVSDDVEVFTENDEHFWVSVGLSFDERYMIINTGSKTTSEILMLPVLDPTGSFQVFVPRKPGVEYDASFAAFEGAGEHGEDIPLAIVYHNVTNPNFQINLIDLRSHRPPYRLDEGICLAQGSPYGCEQGDRVEPGASGKAISSPYWNKDNPSILQGAVGLVIEGIALYRHFITLSYRSGSLPHIAIMTKQSAVSDYLENRPWSFQEIVPKDNNDQYLYSMGTSGNPSYHAPRMRYSFVSYTRPGQLHELDAVSGRDVLLKEAKVLGDFRSDDYGQYRSWVAARDTEKIPVTLVWRKDRLPQVSRVLKEAALSDPQSIQPLAALDGCESIPMFITGYGAYEISSDPTFSVSRLSLLDRGVLFVVAHVRGGGEMGRAWYEKGRRLKKSHTFEDFIDSTQALQRLGYAVPERTVANGGSAGGLLMGAVANMAPNLYAGIEADVPFVDALTSMLDPSLPLTVTEWDEWGDPLHDAKVYNYMRSYSPYENAPDSPDDQRLSQFPRIFVTTSMNDTRVLYVEPMKWVARLQAAGVDAIAKIEVEAGHGGGSGRYHQWEDISFENAWCLDAMHAGDSGR